MEGRTTEQVKTAPNPTGKGGFGDNPENRNNGGRLPNPLKEYQRKKFEDMTDKQKDAFLKKVSNVDRWKMSEGNPDNNTDVTSGGKTIVVPPQVASIINDPDTNGETGSSDTE